MRASQIIAAVTLVVRLGTAQPALAASNGSATDLKGTSIAVQTTGKTPKKFAGFYPSWKGWVWIGVGGTLLYIWARELGASSH